MRHDALVKECESLTQYFHVTDVPDAEEAAALKTGLRGYANSRLRIFSPEYRRMKRRARQFWAHARGFNLSEVAAQLDRLEQFLIRSREFDSQSNIVAFLGGLFSGMESNWTELEEGIEWGLKCTRLGMSKNFLQQCTDTLKTMNDPPHHAISMQLADNVRRAIRHCEQDGAFSNAQWFRKWEGIDLRELKKHIEELSTALNQTLIHLDHFLIYDDQPFHEIQRAVLARSEMYRLKERIEQPQFFEPLLGELYDGVETPAGTLKVAIDWFNQLEDNPFFEECTAFRDWVKADRNHIQQLQEPINQTKQCSERWNLTRDSLSEFGTLKESWRADSSAAPSDMMTLFQNLTDGIDQLESWANLCRSVDYSKNLGVNDFVTPILQGISDVPKMKLGFEATVYDRIARSGLEALPILRDFTRHRHEGVRDQFQQADRELLSLNRKEIAVEAGDRSIPAGNSVGRVGEYTENALVRHEVQKQKRHLRLRQLMTRAGRAVQQLKPCFMMSPMSVAQFLPPEEVHFDLVIMDEASQIRPEDALGAIARANQLVVVGDPKQLPPTSFFDKFGKDELEEDEATMVDESESVLEVAGKVLQPCRRLRWHYRSQHESLIAFSNSQFYDNDLVVFPSPTRNGGTLGVYFHPVEKATFKGGKNVVEAERVASAIVDHAKNKANESLGVGTFNLSQRELIEECLEKIIHRDPVAREAVERLQDGGLFIKNLENLQGDERDVIFISYTYGPDAESGRVFNRFGPINRETGWRRLNVLVTRARKRIEVFSSLEPKDILGGVDARHRGVNAMRDFLDYAQNGKIPDRVLEFNGSFENEFEEAVGRFITKLGYEVVPQVGAAGYRIDIGVLNPGCKTDFLLGVECDGAMYHSSKSARDRDRLREEIIRSRGWKLHRVWSTDWYHNHQSEEQRLARVLSGQ